MQVFSKLGWNHILLTHLSNHRSKRSLRPTHGIFELREDVCAQVVSVVEQTAEYVVRLHRFRYGPERGVSPSALRYIQL